MLMALCILGGCGGDSEAVVQHLGDTTTKQAVVAALSSTGLDIRYRQSPRLQAYEVIAGEAVSGPHRVGFAVEIDLGGDGGKSRSHANPQPAVVPYDIRGVTTVEGNVTIRTQPMAPAAVGRGFELQSSDAEEKMQTRVSVALSHLFAPRFRQGI